jgi:hypothetical protein
MPLELSSMMPERLAALDGVVDRSQEVLDAAAHKARAMLQTDEEFGWEFAGAGPVTRRDRLGRLVPASRPLKAYPAPPPQLNPAHASPRWRSARTPHPRGRSPGPIGRGNERWVVIQADAMHQIELGDREFVVLSSIPFRKGNSSR